MTSTEKIALCRQPVQQLVQYAVQPENRIAAPFVQLCSPIRAESHARMCARVRVPAPARMRPPARVTRCTLHTPRHTRIRACTPGCTCASHALARFHLFLFPKRKGR